MRVTTTFAILLAFPATALPQQGIVPWAERSTARPSILGKIDFQQRLNQQIPLDLFFRDDTGKQVQLGDYFGKRPVVLQLVYYQCPMLCTLALNGTLRAFRASSFTAGREFEAVTVSINPEETPALAGAKKAVYLGKYGRPAAANGWHFLTGQEPAIHALADAVGFQYAYDPASKQYAHTTGLLVLTPEGRVARYQYGVEYSARDLEFSIVDASHGKIGSPAEKFLLFCFHYDPAAGKYSTAVMNILRASSIAVFLALGTFIAVMVRRDQRKKPPLREVRA